VIQKTIKEQIDCFSDSILKEAQSPCFTDNLLLQRYAGSKTMLVDTSLIVLKATYPSTDIAIGDPQQIPFEKKLDS